ncbi:MAG: hypothetical protein C3F08_00070 [Candidatus Methylomirabilota bacterium]|nr:MAG: hypothetical protein C3F08_00070 [candidate division NC10 bacterium]
MIDGKIGIEQRYAELQTEVEQYVRRARYLEAVSRVGYMVSGSLALEEVLDRALDATLAATGAEAGEIWLLDAVIGDICLIRHRGLNPEAFWSRTRFAVGEGIPGHVMQTGEAIVIPDIANDRRLLRWELIGAGFATLAAVPLLAKGQVVGVFDVAMRQTRAVGEDDMRLLTGIGIAIGMAVTNARLYEELQRANGRLAEQIEELQQAQAQLIATERLRAMGELAAGVAHDFNNALTAIAGQTQLMRRALERDAISRDQSARCLDRQERAVLAAVKVVRRIREATRQHDAEPVTAVALNEVVAEVVEATQPRWQAEPQLYGISIALHTDLAEVPPVTGRAGELNAALTNLVCNAVDALPNGGVITMTTRSVSSDDGRELVELVVADTGVGMSEEVRARVFDTFFTTKGDRGTGLGLVMVRGIVNRYGGTIEVASALGYGTTVTVRLPVASEDVAPTPPAERYAGSVGSLRVLVIDDMLLIGETIQDLLRGLGHDVELVKSGEAGLACLETGRFDLVITDLSMPGMSGWDVAAAVKARRPSCPVIMVTGWAEEVEPEMVARSGVDLVLTKPFTVAQLSQALAQVLLGAGRERERERIFVTPGVTEVL